MLRVADCIAGRIWFAIPRPTEWQRIGNQSDAAFICARADFVKLSPNQFTHLIAAELGAVCDKPRDAVGDRTATNKF